MKGRAGIKQRQRSALNLLEAQIKRGSKPEKVEGSTTNNNISLTESDVKKINTQIEVLKKRVS